MNVWKRKKREELLSAGIAGKEAYIETQRQWKIEKKRRHQVAIRRKEQDDE